MIFRSFVESHLYYSAALALPSSITTLGHHYCILSVCQFCDPLITTFLPVSLKQYKKMKVFHKLHTAM